MTKVIGFLNEKGGAGKTTMATNVACWLHQQGYKVALVDIDPQRSATKWSETRESEDVFPVMGMGKQVARDLPRLTGGCDYVILDGAPQISELITPAIKTADLVLIPCQPSPFDIYACENVVDLIHARQDITDGKPKAAFVVSRAIKNTHLGREVRDALAEYDLPVFSALTTSRVAFADCAKGGSVMDLPASDKARQEIEALGKEILEALNG
jgi:chromosome partitioning protein